MSNVSNQPTTPDYLTESLRAYWFAPPVALWRAIELRVAAEEQYERPLLDLGCGDGLVGQVLFGTAGYADVGADLWADQLHRAVRSGVYRHVNQADGHHLPYTNGTFATVFSNSVLEHIADVWQVVQEVGRVLRCPDPDTGQTGGRFIFTVPSDVFRYFLDGYVRRMAAGRRQAAEAYAAAVDARLEHYHYFTPREWQRLLANAGMTMIEARYYIPQEVEQLWDQMNARYSIGQRRSAWGLLVSPHLRLLGYQAILRQFVVRTLSRRWRRYYAMDVPHGEKGGGLLIAARRED